MKSPVQEIKSAVVIGAGGHAVACLGVLSSVSQFKAVAFIDPRGVTPDGYSVPAYKSLENYLASSETLVQHALLAVGDNAVRARLFTEIVAAGLLPITLLSERASVAQSSLLGEGIVVMPGAVIGSHSVIADAAIVNSNATVEHNSTIGFATHVGPGAVLCGNCEVGDYSLIGAGAVLTPGAKVGKRSTVAAGAVVVQEVPDDVVVAGIPARVKRLTK